MLSTPLPAARCDSPKINGPRLSRAVGVRAERPIMPEACDRVGWSVGGATACGLGPDQGNGSAQVDHAGGGDLPFSFEYRAGGLGAEGDGRGAVAGAEGDEGAVADGDGQRLDLQCEDEFDGDRAGG